MSEISKEFALSQVYTNHSLRATTVHVLDAANIAVRHIMSVTGHKSESIFVYCIFSSFFRTFCACYLGDIHLYVYDASPSV
jgi:hypothetical protein